MLPKVRIIVAGGRDFNDYKLVEDILIDMWLDIAELGTPSYEVEFVLGGAKGADSLGEKFADEYGFDKKMFIPDWKGQGKKAGILRNHEMGDYATHLVAFWDGKSRGTKDMIDYATRKGLVVKVIRY